MASKPGGAERGATKFVEGGTPKAPRGASKFGAKNSKKPKAPRGASKFGAGKFGDTKALRGMQKFYDKGGTTGI